MTDNLGVQFTPSTLFLGVTLHRHRDESTLLPGESRRGEPRSCHKGLPVQPLTSRQTGLPGSGPDGPSSASKTKDKHLSPRDLMKFFICG